MNYTVEYYIIVKDVLRDEEFHVKCDSETELQCKYHRYKNDTDYEVLSMYALTITIQPLMEKYIIGGEND